MDKPNVRLVSAAVSDKGLSNKRPVNEDSYLEMTERGLFAVADGVGGAQAGDFASQTAMEVLHDAFSHTRTDLDAEELVEMAIQRANESIYQMAHELPQLETMATTIVALHIDGNIATIGHVGDSRLYRLDAEGNLFRETNDHSVVEEEVRAGRMTEVQAANHPSRNVISRALGAESAVEVEMRTIMFEPGTAFMLCSDGITRHVQDHEIREILGRNQQLRDACDELKAICFERGAEDNLTAVVVRVEDANAPVAVFDEDANAPVAVFDEDDEPTVAGVRAPVFAPNPLPTLANGMSGASSTETRTSEFAALPTVNPDASTAPLEEPLIVEEIQTQEAINRAEPQFENRPEALAPSEIIAPTSPTIEVINDAPAPTETALQSKIDNDRIRAKIDSAEPSRVYQEPAKRGGGAGGLFSSLLLLLLGAALGAGGYYAWTQMNPQPVVTNPNVAPSPQPIQTPPGNSDLAPQEINEFRMFERVRRTVDSKPANFASASQTESAADFYLRGRALLQIGKYDEARDALIKAEQIYAQADGVNQETLRVDIAFAKAALGAMALTGSNDKKMLDELINSKRDGAPPPAEAASPAANR